MAKTPDGMPTATDDFLKGLFRENPVLVQVPGTCPTLAVSNSVRNALAMGLATLFVLIASNAAISALRKFIPKQVRMASYILVIATFVTIVDYAIQAISLDVHKALGAKLVQALAGGADRRAHYACVLVLVRRTDDP